MFDKQVNFLSSSLCVCYEELPGLLEYQNVRIATDLYKILRKQLSEI